MVKTNEGTTRQVGACINKYTTIKGFIGFTEMLVHKQSAYVLTPQPNFALALPL